MRPSVDGLMKALYLCQDIANIVTHTVSYIVVNIKITREVGIDQDIGGATVEVRAPQGTVKYPSMDWLLNVQEAGAEAPHTLQGCTAPISAAAGALVPCKMQVEVLTYYVIAPEAEVKANLGTAAGVAVHLGPATEATAQIE
ncbi:hypothetical protein GWK47_038056 [Chionoecetes opilio]|uniref:Uncharacterized protein n=1 Tax=Chionoecetes opilio TaxID=41210 RepID=A0A8J4YCZ0_CHIOP|nr:hypothetical protein GWK47_038056 [Chionoecetes opilio]